MGSCKSRHEKEIIEDILTDLIIRLDEEEGKIHYYVKRQISEALSFYSTKLENNYTQGNDRIIDMIKQAKRKLQNVETPPYGSFQYRVTGEEQVAKMKKFFQKIQMQMKLDQIEEDEYANIMNIAASYAQKLNVCHKASMSREDKDDLAVLILKLFIRSPKVTVSRVLEDTLENLNEVLDNFDRINMADVNECHEYAEILKQITEKVDNIKRKLKRCSK